MALFFDKKRMNKKEVVIELKLLDKSISFVLAVLEGLDDRIEKVEKRLDRLEGKDE